jgi:hypothetical protein
MSVSDLNHSDFQSVILTGQISRRVAKYATEEERQQAKLQSYKKYASKKYVTKP